MYRKKNPSCIFLFRSVILISSLLLSFSLSAQENDESPLFKTLSTDTNIVDFTARFSEGKVYLVLVVDSLKEDRQYLVKKSLDGNSFNAIGNIKCSKALNAGELMYTFMDDSPAYTYLYYRLVYFSNNNDSVYSKTIGVLAGNDGSNRYVTMDDDIWVMNSKNEKMIPYEMEMNTADVECNAFPSTDGSTLYFSSDREGGYGGKDIWACEKMSNGSWSRPYNLGSEINTDADEDYPVMLGDGVTLFFSRNDKMEGTNYSAMFCTLNDEGFWSESENVSLLNSERKDYFKTVADTLLGRSCNYHVLKGFDVTDAPPVVGGASK